MSESPLPSGFYKVRGRLALLYGGCVYDGNSSMNAAALFKPEDFEPVDLAALERQLAFLEEWYAVRWKRLKQLVHEEAPAIEARACAIMANGTADSMEPHQYDQALAALRADAERCRKALRKLLKAADSEWEHLGHYRIVREEARDAARRGSRYLRCSLGFPTGP